MPANMPPALGFALIMVGCLFLTGQSVNSAQRPVRSRYLSRGLTGLDKGLHELRDKVLELALLDAAVKVDDRPRDEGVARLGELGGLEIPSAVKISVRECPLIVAQKTRVRLTRSWDAATGPCRTEPGAAAGYEQEPASCSR